MSTSISERAEARFNRYGGHVRAWRHFTGRQSCVPESLQSETVFVVLAAERQALFDARARAVAAARAWWDEYIAAQDAATGHVPHAVEIALETGEELPAAPVDGLVSPHDRSRVQWPYAELLADAYWQHAHRCLDAEERARVIELGQDPTA